MSEAYKWLRIEAWGRGWHDVLYWEYFARWDAETRDSEVETWLTDYYHQKEYWRAEWDDVDKPPKEWLEKCLERTRSSVQGALDRIKRYEEMVKE